MMISKLPTQSATITVMTKAVLKASKGLLRDFSELEYLQVSLKDNKTFVTNADIKADKILKEELLHARPEYSLISEESTEIIGEDPEHKWIIDPLDGTVNYMHGFPHWAISVALEKNKEIIAAVTYDPVKNEMFWAEKGCGAYINDKKIRVSGRRSLRDLLISVGSFDLFTSSNIHPISASLRRTGSATLDMAYVAAGRLDILFAYHESPNIWDTAAGMLLIKEAGGILATKDGVSTNNHLELAMMCNVDLVKIAEKIYRNEKLSH